jgi:hypothetical protein
VVEKGVWNSPASGCREEFRCLQSSRHLFQRDPSQKCRQSPRSSGDHIVQGGDADDLVQSDINLSAVRLNPVNSRVADVDLTSGCGIPYIMDVDILQDESFVADFVQLTQVHKQAFHIHDYVLSDQFVHRITLPF